jgi:alpha-N-arabinofuranosidase
LILTNGADFILTPTYHVFDLYQVHQDAMLLDATVENGASYTLNGESLPQLSVSASKNNAGVVHVSLCNLDSRTAAAVTLDLSSQATITGVSGRIVTADTMQAHNTFAQPEVVTTAALQTLSHNGQQVQVQLPPMAVAVVAIH